MPITSLACRAAPTLLMIISGLACSNAEPGAGATSQVADGPALLAVVPLPIDDAWRKARSGSRYGDPITGEPPTDEECFKQVVIPVGGSLTASNRNGTLTISAPGPLTRRFEWTDGYGTRHKKNLIMTGRGAAFHGLTGIYTGGNYGPFDRADPARIVGSEGRVYFDTLDDALNYLRMTPSADWIITRDGLAFGLFPSDSRSAVNFELLQIYVKGQKASISVGTYGRCKIERARRVDMIRLKPASATVEATVE